MNLVLGFSITVLISSALLVFLAALAYKHFQGRIMGSILNSIVTSLLILTVIGISFTAVYGGFTITQVINNAYPAGQKTYLIALVTMLIVMQLKVFFSMGKTEPLRKIMINL